MRFLRLHNEMDGFNAEGESIKWETPNLELDSKGKFALSSFAISVNGSLPDEPIIISCNLVEDDYHNTDGIILVLPPKRSSYHAMTLEFWKLDSSRPRNIMFTLRGVSVTSLSFVSIVIAFE